MPRRLLRGPALVVSLFLAAAFGCGSSDDKPESCSIATPTCPTTGAPTYANDAAPFLQKYCTSCHAPGASESRLPLETYDKVKAQLGGVKSEISSCAMPPSGTQPSTAERTAFLTWVACGAQND